MFGRNPLQESSKLAAALILGNVDGSGRIQISHLTRLCVMSPQRSLTGRAAAFCILNLLRSNGRFGRRISSPTGDGLGISGSSWNRCFSSATARRQAVHTDRIVFISSGWLPVTTGTAPKWTSAIFKPRECVFMIAGTRDFEICFFIASPCMVDTSVQSKKFAWYVKWYHSKERPLPVMALAPK